RVLVSSIDLAASPLNGGTLVGKGDGGGAVPDPTTRNPVWYETPADAAMGGKSLKRALDHVTTIAAQWCATNPDGFPPVVIHVTDTPAIAHAQEDSARALTSVGTSRGSLWFINVHVASSPSEAVVFPGFSDMRLDAAGAKGLLRISSALPEPMRHVLEG